MENIGKSCFLYIFLCVIFLQSVARPQVPPESVETAEPARSKLTVDEENYIHLGDLIDVDVVGSTEFDWRGQLTPEGFLNNPNYTGSPIFALCQSEEEVSLKVAESYAKILRNPQVVIKILDRSNRPVSILYGAVKKNQRFQIKRPVLLNELIILSGGFTEQVSGEIQIFRAKNLNCYDKVSNTSKTNGESGERNISSPAATDSTEYINIKISDLLSGKKESNPRILSGDVITVLQASPVYITGAVAAPRQIPVRSSIALTRAIDSAGGLSKDADAGDIRIFRRSGIQTQTIAADLNKIKSGQSEEVLLQPFDVVEVGQTGRAKRKFPPVIKSFDTAERQASRLPLQIID